MATEHYSSRELGPNARCPRSSNDSDTFDATVYSISTEYDPSEVLW
jgi:hypothetical protein